MWRWSCGTPACSKNPVAEKPERLDFPNALFQAQWKPASGGEPSGIWTSLALAFLERGATDQAMKVIERINEPCALIAMRVDKRFEPVVKADPNHFDIERAQAAQTALHRAALAAEPGSLLAVQHLASSLFKEHKYRDVLRLVDDALGRLQSGDLVAKGPPKEVPWLMNRKAYALEALGRYDEAVDELRHASHMPEDGGTNISQTINLALLLCRLDRPKDALATVGTVSHGSGY